MIRRIRLGGHHSTFWSDIFIKALSLGTTNTLFENCLGINIDTVNHIAERAFSVAGRADDYCYYGRLFHLFEDQHKVLQAQTAVTLSMATVALVFYCLLDTSLRLPNGDAPDFCEPLVGGIHALTLG